MFRAKKIYFLLLCGMLHILLNGNSAKCRPIEKIPFTIEQGRIILKYDLNGVTVRLLYDCASNLSVIDTSFYTLMGSKFQIESAEDFITAGAGSFKLFRSGNYLKDSQFKGLFFDPAAFKVRGASFAQADGIIGGHILFNNYVVEWNFIDQYLAVYDSMPSLDTLKYSVKKVRLSSLFRSMENLGKEDVPALPAILNWKDQLYFVRAFFDTGCPGNFYCIVTDSTLYPRERERIPRLSIPSLQIDSLPSPYWVKAPNTILRLSDRPIGVYIGLELFQRYARIVIDWRNRVACFLTLNSPTATKI